LKVTARKDMTGSTKMQFTLLLVAIFDKHKHYFRGRGGRTAPNHHSVKYLWRKYFFRQNSVRKGKFNV